MKQRGVRCAVYLIVVSTLALLWSCGKPFNVKPNVDLGDTAQPVEARVGDVSVAAALILNEDRLFEVFDANLILAGVLPVEVKVMNHGGSALKMRELRFELRDAGGRELARLEGRDAFKRLISYYGISIYRKSGYRQSLEEFKAYELDRNSPLEPTQARDGLVFFKLNTFKLNAAENAPAPIGLVLSVRPPSSKEAVELKLQPE